MNMRIFAATSFAINIALVALTSMTGCDGTSPQARYSVELAPGEIKSVTIIEEYLVADGGSRIALAITESGKVCTFQHRIEDWNQPIEKGCFLFNGQAVSSANELHIAKLLEDCSVLRITQFGDSSEIIGMEPDQRLDELERVRLLSGMNEDPNLRSVANGLLAHIRIKNSKLTDQSNRSLK
jgi:hypothetical protein